MLKKFLSEKLIDYYRYVIVMKKMLDKNRRMTYCRFEEALGLLVSIIYSILKDTLNVTKTLLYLSAIQPRGRARLIQVSPIMQKILPDGK